MSGVTSPMGLLGLDWTPNKGTGLASIANTDKFYTSQAGKTPPAFGKTTTTPAWGAKDYMGLANTAFQGLQAGVGLMNAFTGLDALNQAKKQFKFEKALAERNLANQAQLVNNYIGSSANVAAGLSAIPTLGSAYNADMRDRFMANADKTKVSGKI